MKLLLSISKFRQIRMPGSGPHAGAHIAPHNREFAHTEIAHIEIQKLRISKFQNLRISKIICVYRAICVYAKNRFPDAMLHRRPRRLATRLPPRSRRPSAASWTR